MQFSNFVLPINEVSIISFIAISLLSYFFIFKEHHKRNKLKFHEIYPLVISYLIICIVSFLSFLFGVDRVLTGYIYNDEFSEIVKEFITGFAIISVVIINFIFYVKRHKVDLIQEEREAQDIKASKIAEIIELVIFSIMFILPIFNIFRYISYIDKAEKIRQICGAVLFMIVSAFLLYSMNPLDIKNKIKKIFTKK